MWIFCVCASKHNPTCGKNKKEERFILMKKLLSVALALLMLAVMLPVKAKLFCPEIAGLFCRIAGLFCHDSRANLSLKPVCFGIAIS